MSRDEELERLKAERMSELQARQQQSAEQQRAAADAEAQKQTLMRRLLTPEARQRLANIKMVRPDSWLELDSSSSPKLGGYPSP
jgi:programmed cell death protein 5